MSLRFDKDGTTTLNGARLVHETDSAMLIEFDGVEAWVPKSMIEDHGFDDNPEESYIEMPTWMADDKEFFE